MEVEEARVDSPVERTERITSRRAEERDAADLPRAGAETSRAPAARPLGPPAAVVRPVQPSATAAQLRVGPRRPAANTREQVARGLLQSASVVREFAPRSGGAATIVNAAADALRRAGLYLDSHDASDMRTDAESVIVRRAYLALAGALLLGYIAGKGVRR